MCRCGKLASLGSEGLTSAVQHHLLSANVVSGPALQEAFCRSSDLGVPSLNRLVSGLFAWAFGPQAQKVALSVSASFIIIDHPWCWDFDVGMSDQTNVARRYSLACLAMSFRVSDVFLSLAKDHGTPAPAMPASNRICNLDKQSRRSEVQRAGRS